MIELSIEETCKRLHWHDSWAEQMIYDADKQKLTIEIQLCEWINDTDFLFNGQEGKLIFHGVSDYEIDSIIPSENTNVEFSVNECLSNNGKMGLMLAGYSYKDIQGRSHDWFTLRFLADSATWYPKTDNEEPKTNN